MFLNIAPLCPQGVLHVIEKAATGEGATEFLASDVIRRQRWIWLLRALAYEPEMFDRAANVLARICAANAPHGDRDNSRTNFEELFHIVLSGTKAQADQRLAFIQALLKDRDTTVQELALVALDGMLESGQFTSGHDFSFGARPRDFGWHPKTSEDVAKWYRVALLHIQELCDGKSPFQLRVRAMLARHFRSLWMHSGVQSELLSLAQHIAKHGGWPDGWIAVRMTLKYGKNNLPPAAVERLSTLESELRPKDLEQKLEAYVLSQTHGHLDIADVEAREDTGEALMAAWEVADKVAESLGRQFSVAPDLLAKSLPRLLSRGQGRQWAFGRGLAMDAENLESKWREIREAFAALDPNERNILLLQGFITAAMERDRLLAGQFLDEAVDDPVLDSYFPFLQAVMVVDDAGAARLSRSVARGAAKAWTYRQLGLGRASGGITPSTFRRLVLQIARVPDGFPTALHLLEMRLHILKTDKAPIDEDMLALGRKLLTICKFNDKDDNVDYHIAEIARACLRGPIAESEAKRLCENFVQALEGNGQAWRYDQLAKALFEIQPEVALDVFFDRTDNRGRSALFRMSVIHEQDGPVNCVPKEILLSWASNDVPARFPWLAAEIRLFDKGSTANELRWSAIALHLLEHATDRKAVLNAFSRHIEPHSWSGSLADVLTPYLNSIRQLLEYPDPVVREWALTEERRLVQRIEQERKHERRIDTSFE